MLLTSPIPTAPPTGETQVLGTRGSSDTPSGPTATGELTRRGASSRRRGWLLFAAVVALAGLAVGIGWWFGAGPGATVTIADVRGQTVEAARAILDEQGVLVADALGERFDLEVEEGRVVATDPEAGTTIDRETEVTIVVSLGPEPTTVPDVVGQPEADARAALLASGFELGASILQFDADVAEGSVIAVLDSDEDVLEAGADSFRGTPVVPLVSVGEVPDVRGLTVEAAQAALSSRELTGIVGGTSEFDNDVALGDVLRVESTSPGPVRPGATLTIIVSRGPDLVEVPNVVGRAINDAVDALEEAGFRVELDTNVPPGLRDSELAPVQSTSPAGGDRVLRNSVITVVARY
jgi:serine/threonine-protein kinase